MGSLKNLDNLLSKFTQTMAPGAALRVYSGKNIVYEHCEGWADMENKIPFAADTICHLASMTKCIAVTAAMQLYEKGEFLLTDPVSDYIPEFKDHKVFYTDERGYTSVRQAKNTVTVGNLFDMTSGITVNWHSKNPKNPNDELLSEATDKLQAEGKYNLQEYAKVCGQTPGAFEAGEHFLYGQSHDVLAAVIEIISGMTFGEYLKKNIFEPLGICDMHFFLPDEKKSRVAVPYILHDGNRIAGKLPPIFYTKTFESACGGLWGTLDDYSRFALCMTLGEVNGVRLLNDRTIRLMAMNRLSPQALKDFENPYHSGYGYGLGVRTRMHPEAGSNTSVGEFGWTGGFGSWVLMDPTAKITIVYMHQSMPNNEGYIHPRIRNIVYSAL